MLQFNFILGSIFIFFCLIFIIIYLHKKECVVPENIHTQPMEGNFNMTPLPSGFSKNGRQNIRLPPPEIPIFSYTPWKCFYFLFKVKN